ncbi:MAG TPA: hypothetical protein VF458_21005 [Ktedonobacteraceae bacterium]
MIPLTTNPRTIKEEDFPAQGAPEEHWLFLLNYALLAPSEYNTQPWKFRVQGEQVELRVDTSRQLPVVDPEGREMLISGGAACLNLRLAAHHFGYQAWMENCMLNEQPELLARLGLGMKEIASEDDESLFAAIPLRHTNRSAYDDRAVPEGILAQLQHDAGQEGTWLQIVQDEPTRQAVTRLIVAGDREQWADKRFRHELAEWVRSGGVESADGLPGTAQAKGSIHQMASPFVVRTFDLWREEAARDRQLTAAAPVLAVLGTFADTRADWFAAGRALERVLLRACASGLQTSFVNQPIEVPSLRDWLRKILMRDDYPQLVIRIGYGEPHITTSRRCVQDVLVERD